MEKLHIERNTVQETLVIPLYGRMMCNRMFPELFKDEYAEKLIERLDYDFSNLEKQEEKTFYQFGALEIAMRQTDLQYEIKDYLKTHPKAAVVNLGCGLDMSGRSTDNGSTKIYNIDFPDTIEIRNTLVPPADREVNIGADLNDFSWFDRIDDSDGAIFIASGVFYYFTKEKVQALFKAMNNRFPGARLAFDTCGKSGIKLMLKTWIKEADIKDVGAYFHVEDIEKDIRPWSNGFSVSSKPYMQGYTKLDGKNVKWAHKLLAKLGDGPIHMQIVRIDFKAKQ